MKWVLCNCTALAFYLAGLTIVILFLARRFIRVQYYFFRHVLSSSWRTIGLQVGWTLLRHAIQHAKDNLGVSNSVSKQACCKLQALVASEKIMVRFRRPWAEHFLRKSKILGPQALFTKHRMAAWTVTQCCQIVPQLRSPVVINITSLETLSAISSSTQCSTGKASTRLQKLLNRLLL